MTGWTNWAGDQSCHPIAIERPRTLDELRRLVADAGDAGRTIRVAATGHSFTDIALTDGVMVSLDHLTRTLDFDGETGLFRVEGGIVLAELNRAMHQSGVAFENLGDIDRQTVAGSISTGTHGTGERFQNVSAQIAALELVTAGGELVTIDESEPDLLRAARVGLGALGIIYSVTVRTVPSYTLDRVDSPKPLGDTLNRLDELNAGTDHFEFYVFPDTDIALCRESRRTDEPPAPRHPALVYAQEVMLENWVGQALRARRPPLPFAGAAAGAHRLARRGALAARSTAGTGSSPPSGGSSSPRWSTGSRASTRRAAIERVLEVAARPKHAVAFPIEVRFVAADDSMLSPSHAARHLLRRRPPGPPHGWEPYFREVEAIAREYGGRPHWGKRHFQTAATLAPLYPRWADFAAVRSRLDPGGLFRNDYTERVLGPVA